MDLLTESIFKKDLIYTVSHVLIVIFALILGLLAYKRSPNNPNNKSFLALNLYLVLWAVVTYFSNLIKIPIDIQIILNRLTFSTGFILVIAFFNFCLVFPDKSTTKPLSYRLVLITCVILAIYSASADWLQVEKITKELITFKPRNPIIFKVYFYAFAIFPFWALAILFSKMRKLKGKKRTQVQYVFMGVLFFLGYVFGTNLIPAFFGRRIFIGHTALGATIFVGLASYAVIKHRLMDIRLVVLKSVSYSVLAALGVSAYIVLVFYLKKYYESIVNPDVVFVGASFVIAFGARPIARFTTKYTDKFFAKGHYNLEELLKKISNILSTNLTLDDLSEELIRKLISVIKIKRILFILSNGFQRNVGFTLKKDEIKQLFKMTKPHQLVVADELDDDSKNKILMRKLGIEVLIYFAAENKALGFLALSQKASGDTYDVQDLKLLEIIAPQITIALKNIEQQQQMIEQIVEERQRINQDAHDHIYNRLGALAKRAELASTSRQVKGEVKETLDLLKTDLRVAVNDLQKIVAGKTQADDIGGGFVEDELKKICEDFEKQSNIKLSLDCASDTLRKLAPQNLWHFQCILEECLNNIRKHSKATEVEVSIISNNGSIIMQVRDNGVGMNRAKRRDLPASLVVNQRRQAGVRGEDNMDESKNGMGLKGMKERAKKINGEITFKSNNSFGTTVELKLPLP